MENLATEQGIQEEPKLATDDLWAAAKKAAWAILELEETILNLQEPGDDIVIKDSAVLTSGTSSGDSPVSSS